MQSKHSILLQCFTTKFFASTSEKTVRVWDRGHEKDEERARRVPNSLVYLN